MKTLFLIICLISNTYATTLKIFDLCSPVVLYAEHFEINQDTNVADLTLKALQNSELYYRGNQYGIHSINNSPVSDKALEIISENHMRSYGWCFSVNGVQPGHLMHEVPILASKIQTIEWYDGYAEYKNGQWLSYCTPHHTRPQPFICQH